jgi:hypothetical protein
VYKLVIKISGFAKIHFAKNAENKAFIQVSPKRGGIGVL